MTKGVGYVLPVVAVGVAWEALVARSFTVSAPAYIGVGTLFTPAPGHGRYGE
jgi:hypothetical protein